MTSLHLPNRLHSYWLIMEILIATGLCLLPIFWSGALTEQTLQWGAIIAAAFLLPMEGIRHFRLEQQVWQQVTGGHFRAQKISKHHSR